MKLPRKISILVFCMGMLAVMSPAYGQGHPREDKRQDDSVVSVPLHLDVAKGRYYVPIKVGTPPQTLSVRLSTRSRFTWLVDVSAGGCPLTGCQYGTCKILCNILQVKKELIH